MNPIEFNKIEKYQQEVARLQRGLTKFNQKLRMLPAKYGFKSIEEFIQALRRAARGKKVSDPSKRKRKAGQAVGAGSTKAKRKRTTITPDMKQKVKALLADEKTGAEIAKIVGISLPSVQNIKKELGLVTKRVK